MLIIRGKYYTLCILLFEHEHFILTLISLSEPEALLFCVLIIFDCRTGLKYLLNYSKIAEKENHIS